MADTLDVVPNWTLNLYDIDRHWYFERPQHLGPQPVLRLPSPQAVSIPSLREPLVVVHQAGRALTGLHGVILLTGSSQSALLLLHRLRHKLFCSQRHRSQRHRSQDHRSRHHRSRHHRSRNHRSRHHRCQYPDHSSSHLRRPQQYQRHTAAAGRLQGSHTAGLGRGSATTIGDISRN
ncbi:hypothetical protein V8E54_009296 [Elaphomyces granulatus]